MRSVEASAKTRQEAIKKALDELGVELHEVQIEILDEGSRGILGIGARDVRVRVAAEGLPEPAKPKKPERPERQEKRHAKPEKPPQAEKPPKPERPVKEQKPVAEERPTQEEKPAKELTRISDSRREEAAALLGEVIAKMGIEATVASAPTEDGGARINVESPDSAILIGRKGKNLQALQYLINRMISAGETSETMERIMVDVESYLDRRRQSLEEMARQLAQKAKETGRDVRVKPLSPLERRIIHLTLQDDPDVRTFSLGNSTMRNVVISPKQAAREAPRQRRGRGGSGRRNGPSRGQHQRNTRSRGYGKEQPPRSQAAESTGSPSEPTSDSTQD